MFYKRSILKKDKKAFNIIRRGLVTDIPFMSSERDLSNDQLECGTCLCNIIKHIFFEDQNPYIWFLYTKFFHRQNAKKGHTQPETNILNTLISEKPK